MAMSLAADGDLVYRKEDVHRFYRAYRSGPEGIFLKRGAEAYARDDTLYFGKAFAYPLVAAPFVRIAGLNGMLLLNVLLFGLMLFAGYVYLAAHSPPAVAVLGAIAFFGASIVPLYAVFLSSDLFNAACVTLAYCFWLLKETPDPSRGRRRKSRAGGGSDIVASILLGVVTFSKPSHVLLILPLIFLEVFRGRVARGALIAMVFVGVVAAGFATNAYISGEVNYQGGDRRTFYGHFPFETAQATFDNTGITMTTNSVDGEAWHTGFLSLLPRNA